MPTFKNAKGGAWIQGEMGNRSLRRSSKRRRFSRLARPVGKTPFWVVAKFPGAANNWDDQAETPSWMYAASGNATTEASTWLLALQAERVDQGAATVTSAPIEPSTTEAEDENMNLIEPRGRYRIVGSVGSLYFSPLESLADPPLGVNLSGFIAGAWFKVEKRAGGTLDDEYPWLDFSQANAGSAGAVSGYRVPAYQASKSATLGTEPRLRYDMMHSFCKPWHIDGPIVDVSGELTGGTGTISSAYAAGSPWSVQLPVPRRMVWNIGRGEAVGLIVTWWDLSGNPTAPVATFTQANLRFKCIALD